MPSIATVSRLSPELLAEAGQQLYGADWQRPLARVLGAFHPDGPRESIDDRLVRRWAAGERPVADWVPRVLAKLLDRQADTCADLADRIRKL